MDTAERGAVTAEFAIVAPVLMVAVLGVVQFGLWYHAQSVARTAAIEAARTAAAEEATVAAGRARGIEVLKAGLGRMPRELRVGVLRDADLATARVSARIPGLLGLPGLSSLRITAQASAYRERFRKAGDY